jgi:hypothetical protein
VGLAHRLAYAGHAVQLLRLGDDDRAEADASAFLQFEFADTPGAPIEVASVPGDAEGVVVLEAPPGADARALAAQLGARLVIVGDEGLVAPGDATVVVNHVPASSRVASNGALRIPEDRLLAAPTVGRLIEAAGASVLTRSHTGDGAICEHIVIAAISHDPADDYMRRFARKAVVCRSSRVDLALGAMIAGTELLLLTGGEEPSPYILDRAAGSRATTLALAPGNTVDTVRDIEASFGRNPFSHEAKAERIGALLASILGDEQLSELVT